MRIDEAEFERILQNNPHLKIHDSGRKAAAPAPTSRPEIPTFDSEAEERYYHKYVLPGLQTGVIQKCEVHKTYELVEAFTYCGKKYKNRVYTPDFVLHFRDGSVEVIEIKGRAIKKLQRDYPLRRQLFLRDYCIPNGWRFREIHDDET